MDTQDFKRNEALQRAMPVTRMVDYGMPESRAQAAHEETTLGARWETALEVIAAELEAEGDFRGSAAALNFAQMAENFDTPERVARYSRATETFAKWAATQPNVSRFSLAFGAARLAGWKLGAPSASPRPAVIVVGGMSGWSTSFVSTAEAFATRGIDCVLLDGPGQGDTRIKHGLGLQAGFPAAVARVAETLLDAGAPAVGIMGNSMGGLFAAMSAVGSDRISACCINGAPTRLFLPDFRTAREQLAAMFGASNADEAMDTSEIAAALKSLQFDGTSRPLTCPVLVCEGGADPLVPLGSQHDFLIGNDNSQSDIATWPDGEHTIYNHAQARNERVVDWFTQVLART